MQAARDTCFPGAYGALGRQAHRLALRALDTLLPACCLLCGGPAIGAEAADRAGPGRPETRSAGLCAPCSRELPRVGKACRQCALPGPFEDTPCGACLRRPPAFGSAAAALMYDYPVDRLVQSFKFGRSLAAGDVLAAELAAALASRRTMTRPDVAVPVPLHALRRAQRGFNQSEWLGRRVARRLGIPLRTGLLHRVRRTRAQSGLARADRSRNLRGAFRSRGVEGLRIALVDDVLTTGTTLDECARTLRAAGAAEIEVWVAARVSAPHPLRNR